jgi:cytochrome c5
MKRLMVFVLLSVTAVFSNAADEAVVTKYNRSCISCHAAGAANAPRTGDVTAWKPRLAKGMDTLVANVNKGFNAMPPKGMCIDCSDADYKALIEYMAKAK